MSNLKLRVWDRQPGETSKAWNAFLLYRDAPSGERMLKSVSEVLKISVQAVGRWSTKFRWAERVREYDSYVDRSTAQEKRIETERAKVEMLERHTKSTVHVQNKVVNRWLRMSDAEWNKLSIPQTVDIFEKMAKFERLSRGLPTDSIEVRTPEQIRSQQITEAKLYLSELRHEFPQLSDADRLEVVCKSFEVTAEELDLDDAVLNSSDFGDE